MEFLKFFNSFTNDINGMVIWSIFVCNKMEIFFL